MKNRDELLKARQERVSNIFNSFDDDLEKGKKAQIGEEREWNGQKYKKVSEGQWVPVNEGGKPEKKEDEPKETEAKKEEGGSESSSEKEESALSEMNTEQKAEFKSAVKAIKQNTKYLGEEGPMANIAKNMIQTMAERMAIALGMPREEAKNTRFSDIPALQSEATVEQAMEEIASQLGKKYGNVEKQVTEAIQGDAKKTGPRENLKEIKADLKDALRQRFEDPYDVDAHDKVNDLVAETMSHAGMPYDEAMDTPWTEDELFGGGSHGDKEGDLEATMGFVDDMYNEIQREFGGDSSDSGESKGGENDNVINPGNMSAQQKLDSHTEKINNTIKENEAELRAFAEANGHTGEYTKFEDLGQYGFRSIANDPKLWEQNPALAEKMMEQFEKNAGLIDSANREKATQFMQEKAPDAAQALKEAGLSVAKVEDRGRNNFTVEIDHPEAGATGGKSADDAVAKKVKEAFGGFKASKGYRGHSGRSISIDFNGKSKLKKSHEDEIQDHINSRINNITKGFE